MNGACNIGVFVGSRLHCAEAGFEGVDVGADGAGKIVSDLPSEGLRHRT